MKTFDYNPAFTKTPRVALQCADNDNETMIDASIKAIILPIDILQQLRAQNIVLEFLNQGEIDDIVQACKFDATLADDPDGISFRDKISLTDAERKNGRGKRLLPAWYYHEKENAEEASAALSY